MTSGNRARSTPIQPTPEMMCRISTALRHRGGSRRGRRSRGVVVVMMLPIGAGGAYSCIVSLTYVPRIHSAGYFRVLPTTYEERRSPAAALPSLWVSADVEQLRVIGLGGFGRPESGDRQHREHDDRAHHGEGGPVGQHAVER